MQDAKLSSPLALEDRSLWFGRISLREEEVVISGWRWTGPVEERFPTSSITSFEKWTVEEGPNFRMWIDGRRPICGRIERGAGFWEMEMRDNERIELALRH